MTPLSQVLRRYFLTGLATLFPITVTLYVIVTIFNFADRKLGRLLGFEFPGLGLVVTILMIFAVGVLSTHVLGRLIFPTVELWFTRLPFVKKIYPAVKQLTRFIFSETDRDAAFRRVVLVQYPRPGAYSIAFVTNETQTTVTGSMKTIVTLLIPNPPSPFTGPIILVPKEDVILLDMSVEDAVKLVVSGGVIAPPLTAR
ncbi:MAG: DUF502 domain-containing protein [Candidatus Omnitrophica bacterium]|nr:DUF502 domain-containing protein [Candidatus Omnitrophota bacterium]